MKRKIVVEIEVDENDSFLCDVYCRLKEEGHCNIDPTGLAGNGRARCNGCLAAEAEYKTLTAPAKPIAKTRWCECGYQLLASSCMCLKCGRAEPIKPENEVTNVNK